MVDRGKLMMRFARETGVIGSESSNRYLWTDAFAVCNFLGLYKSTTKKEYLDLAKTLVKKVHNTLGRYREDDTRSGRLGTEDRPTKGGLRIGKPLPERDKNEDINQVLEWQRDGQYFHYLTKWMYALLQTYKVTQESNYLNYAKDLADASMKFVEGDRMYWKMSINLDYPLVDSMGKHDPLDGYITFHEIDSQFSSNPLSSYITAFSQLVNNSDLRTADSLGLGGLLLDYYRLYRIDSNHNLLPQIKSAIGWGLGRVTLNHQLAFRELGLSLGLYTASKLDIFTDYIDMREEIHQHWIDKNEFKEHRQINTVMLASSLYPAGVFL